MPFGFAAAGAVVGGLVQADAAKSAARTQGRSADRASEVQQDIFDTLNAQQQPFINTGYGANDVLARLLGVNVQRGGPNGNSGNSGPINKDFDETNGQLVGDTYLPKGTTTEKVGNNTYDVFYDGQRIGQLRRGGSNGRFIQQSALPESAYAQLNPGLGSGGDGAAPGGYRPDNTGLDTGYLTQQFGPEQFKQNVDPGYAFRLQQGTQGILNGAASRTGALSGPALKSLIDYNQAAGSQEYGAAFDRFQTQQGNIYQRLLGLTGLGQSAAAGVGAQGVATGQSIGGNIVGAGNAAAAGQVGAANAYGGALGDLGSLALLRRSM